MRFSVKGNKMIINQIVDRCHVSKSNREVIRYVISRLRGGYTTFRQIRKDDRKRFMKAVINRHHANQDVYLEVTFGKRRVRE